MYTKLEFNPDSNSLIQLPTMVFKLIYYVHIFKLFTLREHKYISEQVKIFNIICNLPTSIVV